MPTYEYVCTSCGHEFELVQKMTDPPRRRCPRCRCKVERKIGTGAGIIFKGSGFYATDYRSAEYKAKARAESVGASGGAGGGKPAPTGGGAKPGNGGGGDGSSSGTKPAT